MCKLSLPPKNADSWWTKFMIENIDLIVIPAETGNFIDELGFERALSPWNAEFVGRTIKFPDGSTDRIREIHFETESDMEMFILRWVK